MKIKIPSNKALAVYPAGANAVFIPGGSALDVFKPGIKWLLRDEFTTTLAAGSVNGTNAEPGPGVRTVVDTGSKLSITGSNLVILPQAIPASGDPNIHYAAVTRVPGLSLIAKINRVNTATDKQIRFGWDSDEILNPTAHTAYYYVNTIYFQTTASNASIDISSDIYYYVDIVLRATGCYSFIKGGANTNWTLCGSSIITNAATLYPAIAGSDGTANIDFIRIPQAFYLPPPLLSDGFGSTFGLSDGLGHAEGVAGGLGAGGGGLTWTARLGTWANAAGVASCTELNVGASLGIATATLNTADVLYSCVLGYSAGSGGVIVRYKDAANYVYAIHDGTNVKLFEVTDASPYPGTQRGTGVKAPAAGARLIVDVSGAASRVYYNEALIFTYASVADTTAKTIGLITDNVGNTFNDAVAYAKGTGGEYSYLDRFSRD